MNCLFRRINVMRYLLINKCNHFFLDNKLLKRNETIPTKCLLTSFHVCHQLEQDQKETSTSTGHTTLGNENPYILQPVSKSSSTALKIKNINKAMKAYLERAKNHNIFLTEKNDEFEIGKRHLANMMGIEYNTMTQEDIDKAIEYLLPSGLFEPLARPLMKPPEELFPREKAAQFDDSGRPFNSFFYTRKPNFYQAMHEIVEKFDELDAFEDKMLRKGISEPPENYKLNLSGGQWLTIDEFRNLFLEKLTDIDYDFIVTTLTRLTDHLYAFRCKDFIWKYRKDFVDVSSLESLPELSYDENGRPYIKAEGSQKTARSKVTVWGNGSGKIKINDTDISYFYRLEDRHMIMLPLMLSNMINKVDVEAEVWSGGKTKCQAGAIRYALSMCLRAFVTKEICEKMRLAGLLTLDRRRKERNRPGRRAARAKPRWQKR